MDVLLVHHLLARRGVARVVLVGHSFGGAVAIAAGALLGPATAGVVALSTQVPGTEHVDKLAGTPLLLVHGDADGVLPDLCSRNVLRAGGRAEGAGDPAGRGPPARRRHRRPRSTGSPSSSRNGVGRDVASDDGLAAAAAARPAAARRRRSPGSPSPTPCRVAGDTMVTVALAGSLFFDISPTAARGRVTLSLLLTMAPFAVVAPAARSGPRPGARAGAGSWCSRPRWAGP